MHSGVTMIVLAAGRGRRFGGTLPKQYLPLQSRPILWHSLSRLHQHPKIDTIVPVIAPDGEELWQTIMAPLLAPLPKVTPPVLGGDERQHSVFKALLSLNLPHTAWIGIHDGARPLVEQRVLDHLFQARQQSDAIIPALPASDTIKRIDAHGHILSTLDRETICLAQTPQLFRFGLIFQAHQQAAADGFLGTDDASLVERLNQTTGIFYPVLVVRGSTKMLKITNPSDQELAEQLLQKGNHSDPPPEGGAKKSSYCF